MTGWHRLMRPGDWLFTVGGLLGLLSTAPWQPLQADTVVIRSGGSVFKTLSLQQNQVVEVPGVLGTTVMHISEGRVRIKRDPGPRQLCVVHGWLDRAGQMAICLPNRTSIELIGAAPRADSLSY